MVNELTADEVEAIGLDPTGRDGDARFPYTEDVLTEDELVCLRQYRSASRAIAFDEINVGDVINVRYTVSHNDNTYEINATVKRKYKNSIHLVNGTHVNGSYELIKRNQIVEIVR